MKRMLKIDRQTIEFIEMHSMENNALANSPIFFGPSLLQSSIVLAWSNLKDIRASLSWSYKFCQKQLNTLEYYT